MKFKQVANKRLSIDCWGFAFSENEESMVEINENSHSKVFCYLKGQKENLRDVLAPMMMKMIETAVICID